MNWRETMPEAAEGVDRLKDAWREYRIARAEAMLWKAFDKMPKGCEEKQILAVYLSMYFKKVKEVRDL